MKTRTLICLLFIISSSLFAQTSKIGQEEKLLKLHNRINIKVTEVEKDILKFEYPDGKVIYNNIVDYKYPESSLHKEVYSSTFDSTIIDLTTIDTTLYYQKYTFWQEVRVGTDNTKPPLVGDMNKNGLPEIYGQIKDYNDSNPGNDVVMEMNSEGIFSYVLSYDSTSVARGIYDIDKDGMNELLLHRFPPDTNYPGNSWLFFTQPTDTSLATELSFVFYPFPSSEGTQLDQNTFGNWDGDELTDQIFIRRCCPPTINLFEYNPVINNFDYVYQYDYSELDNFFSGFAIGDVNQNGRIEFFAGSVNGKVIAIENCGNNCYSQIWQGSVETNNAYLYAVTNDLDDNGKPEVWIGGYHFWNGEAITRLTIFEASSNNNYVAVGKIDIIGAFNFYAKNMQVLDVDKDGKDEVMVCIDNNVLILKFNGSVNHQSYEVYYLKRNDLANQGRNSVFYGATMYDLDNDGKEDIIIHMDDINSGVGMKLFTFIYKSNITVDVENEIQQPKEFYLHNNYPNPFNPSTQLKFSIPEPSNVTIKIYNILGKEIATLLDKEISPGSYNINWEAKDSNGQLLSSGVYLVRLNAENKNIKYTRTIKAVLIK